MCPSKNWSQEIAIVVAAAILLSVLMVLPVISEGENVTNASDMGGSLLSELSEAPTSGSWVGTTSEGEAVSFNVSDTQVYNFTVITGNPNNGVTSWAFFNPIDIVENNFQLQYLAIMIYGEFISPYFATGTYRTGTVNITWSASPQPTIPPLTITIALSPSIVTLNVSESQQFIATVKDQNGNPMAGVVITWTSTNATVGTVSQASGKTGSDGKATTTFKALAPGTTTINASWGNVSKIADVKVNQPNQIFDTGSGTYPSIMGTHKGEIIPLHTITVSKLYTYPCAGTGGHTESIELYENGTLIANGTWNGYQNDWHNITLHNLSNGAPYVTLLKDHKYNYIIRTGSYPQIIHESSKEVTGGTITCSSFADANGKIYFDWIPAIRLEYIPVTTSKPTPTPSPIGKEEQPLVEIENNYGLPITVIINGPSKDLLTLSPEEIATHQFPPGEYWIYATAPATLPYSGDVTLIKGYKYQWSFYVISIPIRELQLKVEAQLSSGILQSLNTSSPTKSCIPIKS